MKLFVFRSFSFVLFALVVLSSCTYNNEQDLYPDNFCDTSNVTFTNSVEPFIANKCISCHNASFASGYINLDNYSDIKAVVDDGSFWGVLNHEVGYKPMPLNQSKTSACTLSKIEIWIDQGAPNN